MAIPYGTNYVICFKASKFKNKNKTKKQNKVLVCFITLHKTREPEYMQFSIIDNAMQMPPAHKYRTETIK